MSTADLIDGVFRGTVNRIGKQLEFAAAGRRYLVKVAYAQSPDDGSLLPIFSDVIPLWIGEDNFDWLEHTELAENCLCRDWGREHKLSIEDARARIYEMVRNEGVEIGI